MKSIFRYPEMTIKDEIKGIKQRVNQFVLDKLRNEKKSLVVVASPVETLLTDESGKQIGYENGMFINEIPGAEMKQIDSVEIFLVPSGVNYQVKSVGTSVGTFDLYCIMEKKDGEMQEIIYEKVPVNKNSIAEVKFGNNISEYQMKIDFDGDQVIDKIEHPDYVINPSNIQKNPYDINQDGIINILDMVLLTKKLGKVGKDVVGDVNGDGTVDQIDIDMLIKHFGEKSR